MTGRARGVAGGVEPLSAAPLSRAPPRHCLGLAGGGAVAARSTMELHILEHRVRVLSLARPGLWLYTHPLIKLLFLPHRSRCAPGFRGAGQMGGGSSVTPGQGQRIRVAARERRVPGGDAVLSGRHLAGDYPF